MQPGFIPAEESDSWVRVCRQHEAICLTVEGMEVMKGQDLSWNSRVICPFGNGHQLTMDYQWKVTRRSQPWSRGWNGEQEA